MLISMPTDTSTIFGVFQAILALSLLNRTNFALRLKLMRNKNFASEIFRLSGLYSHAALQNLFTILCGEAPKHRGINSFNVTLRRAARRLRFDRARRIADKERVIWRGPSRGAHFRL
jgi:hypothetical protein